MLSTTVLTVPRWWVNTVLYKHFSALCLLEVWSRCFHFKYTYSSQFSDVCSSKIHRKDYNRDPVDLIIEGHTLSPRASLSYSLQTLKWASIRLTQKKKSCLFILSLTSTVHCYWSARSALHTSVLLLEIKNAQGTLLVFHPIFAGELLTANIYLLSSGRVFFASRCCLYFWSEEWVTHRWSKCASCMRAIRGEGENRHSQPSYWIEWTR